MLKKGLVISAFAALLFGGCDGGSVANNTQTGGSVAASGGRVAATGGSLQATGGSTPATGGAAPATGGAPPATGGAVPATGGAAAATGGAVAATGGTTPTTGGVKATGGITPASGGALPATGGAIPPATGGATPATGGATATGGVRTGGNTPDAGVDTGSRDTAIATGGVTATGGATATGGSACVAPATPATLSKNHNAGKDCAGCHGNNVATTVAGTIYAADGKTAVSGATVTITGSNGAVLKLVTSSIGNFWTSKAVSFPATVEVSKCPDTAKMTKTIANGNCNSSGCHTSAMPITLP